MQLQVHRIDVFILLFLRKTYRTPLGSALGLMVGAHILMGIQDLK